MILSRSAFHLEDVNMRAINIGEQDFDVIREHEDFYIDKTDFIREWWEDRAFGFTEDEVFAALDEDYVDKKGLYSNEKKRLAASGCNQEEKNDL